MSIKEFSEKHAVVLFYSTVVLVVLFVGIAIVGVARGHDMRFDDKREGFDGEKPMIDKDGSRDLRGEKGYPQVPSQTQQMPANQVPTQMQHIPPTQAELDQVQQNQVQAEGEQAVDPQVPPSQVPVQN